MGGRIVTVVEGAERAGSDATNHMFMGSDNAHYLACRRGELGTPSNLPLTLEMAIAGKPPTTWTR